MLHSLSARLADLSFGLCINKHHSHEALQWWDAGPAPRLWPPSPNSPQVNSPNSLLVDSKKKSVKTFDVEG